VRHYRRSSPPALTAAQRFAGDPDLRGWAKAAKPAVWADEPASPAAGDRLEFPWIIGPDRPNPHDPYGGGLPLRPVELVATIGDVSRHIMVADERKTNASEIHRPPEGRRGRTWTGWRERHAGRPTWV